MEHNTTNRRNSASLHPKPSMDPTEKKKYPIYPPSTSKNHHPSHPEPIQSHTTIQSISNNFSKLYTNHKTSSSSKATHKLIQPHPLPEPSFYTTSKIKSLPISSNFDSSCTTLTKSKSQHVRKYSVRKYSVVPNVPPKQGTKTNVVKVEKSFMKPKAKNETTQKEIIKKEDVKKAQSLKCMSYNNEKMQSFLLGRRKSFCSSQTELVDFLLCNGVKVVAVDMPPFMQIHAVNCARKTHDSLEKFTARTLACTLKREFDGVYGLAWHCIVGTSFGSFVTHSVGGFMYFSMDHKLYVLLFKTTMRKAE